MDRLRGQRTYRRNTRDRRRGQSLVEFALVLPLFLLILAGIVDFGMGLATSITVTNATREGARLGTVNPSSAAVIARVQASATGLDVSRLTVTVTCLEVSGSTYVACSGAPWQPGDSMVVVSTYNYRMLWPLAMGMTLPLSSRVEMRVE